MSWYWFAAIAVLVIVAMMSRRGERGERGNHPSARLRRDDSPPTMALIDLLIRERRTIEAIKAYRTLYHVDLKAAKDAVDARARELPAIGHR